MTKQISIIVKSEEEEDNLLDSLRIYRKSEESYLEIDI